MNSVWLSSMLCTAIIVVVALIGLVIILLRPARGKSNTQTGLSSATTKPARKDWKSWLPYFGIALILAIWTIWGAVFFLVVVWLMRQNPGVGSYLAVSENEKKTARRVYTWLFWSPLLTVPVFIIALISNYDSSVNGRVLAALIPLILHTPMLFGLTSKSAFIYRHTQQGILLIALRAGLASLAVAAGRNPEDGLWLFLLGNGGLWLFGSIWGRNQVNRGDCWLMRRKGEAIEVVAGGVGNFAPHVHLEKSREFVQRFKKDEAKAHALAAFRQGNREIKLQALWVLGVLEEVERF